MKQLALFIEPASDQLNIFSAFVLPRLGSFILAGLVNRQPHWHARVFVEGRRKFNLGKWIAQNGRPNLVGISTITPTVRRGYQLADECRQLGITVILGGPHVTFLPDEALKHADLVVRGEGEKTIETLLEVWGGEVGSASLPEYGSIPNLSWKDKNGQTHHNPMGPLLTDLDSLPMPDFSLADGTVNCGRTDRGTVVVQTSRGCPFDCSFCSVTGMFGKKFRCRSIESVLEELRPYSHQNRIVFICDDNFTANKHRAREMVEGMLSDGLRLQWSTQVRADVARDPDLLQAMRRAGCDTVFIGMESVNPKSLQEMKKSQTLEEMTDAVAVIHQAGIHIHGMFVLGFDQDDRQTLDATVEFARRMKLTSVQLLILTPLPGSELFKRLRAENRITSDDWNHYDAHHVVFRPQNLTPLQLQWGQVYGHARLYAVWEGIKKLGAGRLRAAGLSFYAWRINRGWQRQNRAYLRALQTASTSATHWAGAVASG